MYSKYFKRFFDIILSFFSMLVLSPVLLIVAILVRINLGKPIIFYQERPGKNEKIFKLYKFRTMTSEVNKDGDLLPDKDRLTKFGRLLRKTSLDELPSLLNILKGDMSIIGPRPLAVQYLPYYNSNEKKRHSVRPGLSGLAQVNGRNTASWEDRFEYDIFYVDNITLKTDVYIVLKTLVKVFKQSDIGERGKDAPMDFDAYRKLGD
ncbi:sugar transferase [Vagococcus carniphilus]|uniref:sugar transferase n=1 Tax=Vagococcus carniphilus TaxID=218144 RepID=UPI00289086BB|nr:sugar transferase [Vagococcus carniphilus]MDT2865752.1 sugar transferase [Vagococcus carniphilus]